MHGGDAFVNVIYPAAQIIIASIQHSRGSPIIADELRPALTLPVLGLRQQFSISLVRYRAKTTSVLFGMLNCQWREMGCRRCKPGDHQNADPYRALSHVIN